jgi:hypothetical protein
MNNQAKSIALAQFHNIDYFVYNGIAYEGSLEDEKIAYANHCDAPLGDKRDTLADWLESECIPLPDYDEDDNYLVLTDKEADERAAEYIRDSLWAFNADFLAGETGIDREVFEAIQANNRFESNNDAIARLIGDDMDSFIQSAISADGRGHFISFYDGHEHETLVDVPHEFEDRLVATRFYIYRMN